MIKIIRQKRNDDCVLCCVAMVANVSYNVARKAFDNEPPYGFIDECVALVRLGLFPDYRDMTKLYRGRIHTITVPSLNMPGVNHRIVIDTRNGRQIYDPLKDVKGKKCYRLWNDIKGFSEIVNIIDTHKKVEGFL